MADQSEELRERYLGLMVSALAGTIYEDPPLAASGSTKYDPNLRKHGWDWPSRAFTMVGVLRLQNVRQLLESVLGEGVPGDFVETGVWRGGASMMAAAVLKAYGVGDRRVYVCDSFEGLPHPHADLYPADSGSTFHQYSDLVVPLEAVRDNFSKFDLLDDQVVFVRGWFRDTMPNLATDCISVLRLDGDMYESTIDPLNYLYDRIPSGGWIIVDDYHVVASARQAVDDFLVSRGLSVRIVEIDGVGICFRKDEPAFLSRKTTSS